MQKLLKVLGTAARIIIPMYIFTLGAGAFCYIASYLIEDKLYIDHEILMMMSCFTSLVIILLYRSVFRYGVLFDNVMRERYIQNRDNINTFFDKLKLFFSVKYTIPAVIVIPLWLCFTPTSYWCPFHYPYFGNGESDMRFRLICFAAAFGLAVILGISAIVSAVNFWEDERYYTKKNGFKYTAENCIIRHGVMFLEFYIGGVVVINIIPELALTVVSFVFVNVSLLFGAFTLCFHLFFIFPKVIKRIILAVKRKKFLQDLDAVCAEHRCYLSQVKNPYRSLFKNIEDEYNFDFERDGVQYACKLIPTKHRLRPMIFHENGVAAIPKIIKIRGVELLRINKYLKYGFEAEGKKKLIVINPIPKRLFVCSKGATRLIDNGDSISGYKIYSATALINAIDRNCLEK